MYYKFFFSFLLVFGIPIASQAELKLDFAQGATICSKATSQKLLQPYQFDPYSLKRSRHPLSAMIQPVAHYASLEKRAVFTEDNLRAYVDFLKKQDSYVLARYYDVSNEQAVRDNLFALLEEKQKELDTLIFAKDVIGMLSPTGSLVDAALSKFGQYQGYWNFGRDTLKQLGIKITKDKKAVFVGDLKTLIANGGQFYYLEGIAEPCTCDGFFIKRVLYYKVNIGSSVRSSLIFTEKLPIYIQAANEPVLFVESSCR